MSYCRFSSDDFRSDVYCYQDVNGGYTTHVADNMYKSNVERPSVPDSKSVTLEQLIEANRKLTKWLDRAKVVKIGLECDGAMFNDPTPLAAAHRLQSLREMGYYVPQHGIDRLLKEARNENPRQM